MENRYWLPYPSEKEKDILVNEKDAPRASNEQSSSHQGTSMALTYETLCFFRWNRNPLDGTTPGPTSDKKMPRSTTSQVQLLFSHVVCVLQKRFRKYLGIYLCTLRFWSSSQDLPVAVATNLNAQR
uniref:Uncharacterized protein n=1 Tax=Chionoecetes opilio bacilliform virus TaxID=1825681 RepID=A0A1Q3DKV8_9VIRU|nr:hypothetical protein [Chionoecetes opilio bacilliform virus]GAV93167.1 hypothetical protein SCV_043 [Chionoecetes opilio bacilliform virus]